MAAKISSLGAEGQLVITADTLRTIGDTVAKTRHAKAERQAEYVVHDPDHGG